MNFTAAGLINLISLVAKPNNEYVVALAERSFLVPKIVRPIAAAVVVYGLLALRGGIIVGHMLAYAFATAVTTAFIAFLDDHVMDAAERNAAKAAMGIGVLGLFIGLASSLLSNQALGIVAISGAGGFCVAWFIGRLGIPLAALFVQIANNLFKALASPIAAPILSFLAYLNNRAMRNDHKAWVTSRGTPIVVFNRNGVETVNGDNDAIFLSSSRLQGIGAAASAGIPLFTLAELSNTSLVNQRMGEALQAFEEDPQFQGIDMGQALVVNPANCLPMIGGSAGIDLMGNPYGFNDH